jgi:hypothetical protein
VLNVLVISDLLGFVYTLAAKPIAQAVVQLNGPGEWQPGARKCFISPVVAQLEHDSCSCMKRLPVLRGPAQMIP